MTALTTHPVADGTGIEWRVADRKVQHRYAAECFGPDGKPGPWHTTTDVDQIVHPARVKAIAEAWALFNVRDFALKNCEVS